MSALNLLSIAEAAVGAAELRRQGKALVFTNGVFDLLHPGHVRYLQQASRLGHRLLVAINSDSSAARLAKGPGRPLTPAAERAEILAALACVDAVTIFDEDTPLETIVAVQPQVLVKGADWAADAVVGAPEVLARGGRVVRVPIEAGYSTSALIARVRARERSHERAP